jgi:hypothetical protein
MAEEQIRHARALLVQPENTVTSIAKLLSVSHTTLYKCPELKMRCLLAAVHQVKVVAVDQGVVDSGPPWPSVPPNVRRRLGNRQRLQGGYFRVSLRTSLAAPTAPWVRQARVRGLG